MTRSRLHCKYFLVLCPRNTLANSFMFPLPLPLPPRHKGGGIFERGGSTGNAKIFLPPRGAQAVQALGLGERSRCALMGEDRDCPVLDTGWGASTGGFAMNDRH